MFPLFRDFFLFLRSKQSGVAAGVFGRSVGQLEISRRKCSGGTQLEYVQIVLCQIVFVSNTTLWQNTILRQILPLRQVLLFQYFCFVACMFLRNTDWPCWRPCFPVLLSNQVVQYFKKTEELQVLNSGRETTSPSTTPGFSYRSTNTMDGMHPDR